MKFKTSFFEAYIAETPLALAIERTFECEIMSRQSFEKPVLDLGCGEGVFASILCAEPVDTGVDINLSELAAAKGYRAHGELLHCPADKIPKPDASYNTIFSNSVLEHIPDIESVLAECSRLLAPSGHFYVTLPTNYFEQYSLVSQFLSGLGMRGLAKRFQGFYNRFWKHYHCYTVKEWNGLFDRAGFEARQTVMYCPRRIAALNDLLTWPALFSLVVKKSFNRWFVFRGLRRSLAPFYAKLIRIDFSPDPGTRAGGLVFFDLVKKR